MERTRTGQLKQKKANLTIAINELVDARLGINKSIEVLQDEITAINIQLAQLAAEEIAIDKLRAIQEKNKGYTYEKKEIELEEINDERLS